MSDKILITGASSDIGISICNKIVKEGDTVILQYYKNKEKLLSLQNKYGDCCNLVYVDFNNRAELDSFCNALKNITILINNAAVIKTDLLLNMNSSDIDNMINVNIYSIIKICSAVIPNMIINRKGVIVNLSSVAAQRGNRGQTVYAGTKGFIESFTRSLSSEYGSKGINVNTVAPGPIESKSLNELLTYAKDEVKNSIISKRIGKPDDVAAMVAFLCSEEAAYINGKIFNVDGGFMKGI